MALSKHKVLFCFHPIFVKWNHGIALLSKLCKMNGIETDLIMIGNLGDMETFCSKISDGRYSCVCFSCVTDCEYTVCKPFIEKASRLCKQVLVGGTYLSLHPPIRSYRNVMICNGECERLPEYLNTGETSVLNRFHADLNDLPLLDYEIFDGIPLEREVPWLVGLDLLPYSSSRGCTGTCTFCQIRHQKQPYRVRSRIAEDLSFLVKEHDPDAIYFVDTQLPYMNKEWIDSWDDFMYPFYGYIRADIPVKRLEFLVERGLKGCAFGIESGDERYRNLVLGKNLKDAEIMRTIECLDNHNIEYTAFYMSNTPEETDKEKAKTLDMMASIGGYQYLWEYKELTQPISAEGSIQCR